MWLYFIHACMSLSVLHFDDANEYLAVYMDADMEKSVYVCDINVCSLCSPCCSAPTVPLGPICLPVINSSGLTMQRFMTLFGLTNYHTPASLSHSPARTQYWKTIYVIGCWAFTCNMKCFVHCLGLYTLSRIINMLSANVAFAPSLHGCKKKTCRDEKSDCTIAVPSHQIT